MTLFTAGYEGTDAEAFIETLKLHGVSCLVDVREIPLSRKTGFSKRALAERLKTEGIDYIHMKDLGCPKSIRDLYRENRNWRQYVEHFLGYLATQKAAVNDLVSVATKSVCCLVCFEADYNVCHRSLVAAEVQRVSRLAISHLRTNPVRKVAAAKVLTPAAA